MLTFKFFMSLVVTPSWPRTEFYFSSNIIPHQQASQNYYFHRQLPQNQYLFLYLELVLALVILFFRMMKMATSSSEYLASVDWVPFSLRHRGSSISLRAIFQKMDRINRAMNFVPNVYIMLYLFFQRNQPGIYN